MSDSTGETFTVYVVKGYEGDWDHEVTLAAYASREDAETYRRTFTDTNLSYIEHVMVWR